MFPDSCVYAPADVRAPTWRGGGGGGRQELLRESNAPLKSHHSFLLWPLSSFRILFFFMLKLNTNLNHCLVMCYAVDKNNL